MFKKLKRLFDKKTLEGDVEINMSCEDLKRGDKYYIIDLSNVPPISEKTWHVNSTDKNRVERGIAFTNYNQALKVANAIEDIIRKGV